MSSEDHVALLTIFLLFGTPLIAIGAIFLGWLINNNRKHGQTLRSQDMFERLARDKLDVIKTAVAMGHDDDQIRELDARLERLLGTDKMASILDPNVARVPQVSAEMLDNDLVREVDRMEELRRKQRSDLG